MLGKIPDKVIFHPDYHTFSLFLCEEDYQNKTVAELNGRFTWKEWRLVIDSVRKIEAKIGNDSFAQDLCTDKRRKCFNIMVSWMLPAGYANRGTLPGGDGTHGGQMTVNMLYREARLWTYIGILLWHRNQYKPVMHPIVGYSILEGKRVKDEL